MSTSLASKLEILQERAKKLSQVRSFFAARSVLEVDVPILSHAAPIDTHIEVMSTGEGYLHTSPEYAMKRLLSQQCGDIYQMCHVFRKGEAGRLHNPEFTMIEWYRIGFTLDQLMQETLSLIYLFLGDIPVQITPYAEIFQKYVGVDYRTEGLDLDYHMAFTIEPQLSGLHVIYDFPSTQAALAQTCLKGTEWVAERFEIYYNGIELANGFHELTDPVEQRRRFVKANEERQKLDKPVLPIDEKFLQALEKGLPDSCGVAVGFDRLLMLQLKKESLAEILPFSWDEI